jgi:transposase
MDRKTFAPTAAAQDATALVAIELGWKKWKVGALRPGAANPSIHDLAGGDLPGLLGLLEELRRGGSRVVVCYEAGRDGFWLQRALAATGAACHVIDPASLPVARRARRAKTDRIDVVALLRALGLWLGGDRQACRMALPPSPAEEDARRIVRERRRLMTERTRHVNVIKGLLALHGVRGFEPLRRDRRARFAALRTATGAALPAALAAELGREIGRLELALEQLAAVEAARDAAVAAPAPEDAGAGRIRLLAKLKSIGVEIATALEREALYRDFANRRQVASYLGLTPTPWRSGELDREQGIGKAGNPRARTTAIELAWLWVRYQPQSDLTRWFKTRVGDRRGRVRKVAIVALARKLVVALWRYVHTGLVPAGAALKAR